MKTTTTHTSDLRLHDRNNQVIPGSWSLDQEKRLATFSESLTDSASYQLVVSSNVRDLALNQMAAAYEKTTTFALNDIVDDTKNPEIEKVWQGVGNMYVRFTEQIASASVTQDAIQTSENGTPVEGLNNKANKVNHSAYGFSTSHTFILNLYHCLGGIRLPDPCTNS